MPKETVEVVKVSCDCAIVAMATFPQATILSLLENMWKETYPVLM